MKLIVTLNTSAYVPKMSSLHTFKTTSMTQIAVFTSYVILSYTEKWKRNRKFWKNGYSISTNKQVFQLFRHQ